MRKATLILLQSMVLTLAAQASIITLHSGNGSVGSNDSLISFLDGPNSTDFASAFTPGNFTSAQGGPAAFIVSPNGAWVPSLTEDAAAKWIGTNSGAASSGDTALYAMSFTLANPVISAAIALHYATDNSLGLSNPGLYLNGTAVSPAPAGGSFNPENSYSNSNIGSLLHQGTNWIYFDAVNVGGPAGLLFTTTITTVDGTSGAPEPATFALLGMALAVIGGLRYGTSRVR